MAEDNRGMRLTMQRIMARNGIEFGDRLALRDGVFDCAALMAEVVPQVLLLADPRLTPETLLEMLPHMPRPGQILLYGRLLEAHHKALGPVEELLIKLGYSPGMGFDPNIARGFVLR
jgi:hypothetical protein